jgi:glucosamine--fructose-6-phosphate aminotransferase (isomerizing)
LFKEISKFKKIFFVGRGQDYVTALEGALKLKEIAYINCIGMPAGELKHGTLALVDDETLVVVVSTAMKTKEKIESNIQEIKARGGKVLLLSNLSHNFEVDFNFVLPTFEESLMPIISIVPLQILAFEFALKLGYNPDKPRNLAKSVTVE